MAVGTTDRVTIATGPVAARLATVTGSSEESIRLTAGILFPVRGFAAEFATRTAFTSLNHTRFPALAGGKTDHGLEPD